MKYLVTVNATGTFYINAPTEEEARELAEGYSENDILDALMNEDNWRINTTDFFTKSTS